MARLSYFECARLWAWQEQERGETRERRMFFEGATIYSYGYHFPIAHITDKFVGNLRVVLFCWQRRSNTTRKHQHEVHDAIRRRGGFKVISVETPHAGLYSTDHHRGNLRDMQERYHQLALRASRARLCNRESAVAEAEGFRQSANEYARIFGIGRYWLRPANVRQLRIEELEKRHSLKQQGMFDDQR